MIDDLLAQIKEEFDKKDNRFDDGVLHTYHTVLCYWRHEYEKDLETQKDNSEYKMSEYVKGILSVIKILEKGYPIIKNWVLSNKG